MVDSMADLISQVKPNVKVVPVDYTYSFGTRNTVKVSKKRTLKCDITSIYEPELINLKDKLSLLNVKKHPKTSKFEWFPGALF